LFTLGKVKVVLCKTDFLAIYCQTLFLKELKHFIIYYIIGVLLTKVDFFLLKFLPKIYEAFAHRGSVNILQINN